LLWVHGCPDNNCSVDQYCRDGLRMGKLVMILGRSGKQ
jgi:hypothetical protein